MGGARDSADRKPEFFSAMGSVLGTEKVAKLIFCRRSLNE